MKNKGNMYLPDDDDEKLERQWKRIEADWTRKFERASTKCMHYNVRHRR